MDHNEDECQLRALSRKSSPSPQMLPFTFRSSPRLLLARRGKLLGFLKQEKPHETRKPKSS